jgi:hypothetical protein
MKRQSGSTRERPEDKMQYMMLVYADESKAPPDLPKLAAEYQEFVQGLVSSGHFRAAGQFQPSPSVATVREKRGKAVVTEGPLAEGQVHLGGYFLVECDNRDEVISMAKRLPGLRFGEPVEIRPLAPQPRPPSHT